MLTTNRVVACTVRYRTKPMAISATEDFQVMPSFFDCTSSSHNREASARKMVRSMVRGTSIYVCLCPDGIITETATAVEMPSTAQKQNRATTRPGKDSKGSSTLTRISSRTRFSRIASMKSTTEYVQK